MKTAICTLFEGGYHFGVAALSNSAHRAGFRGKIYAGIRGTLPPWASKVKPAESTLWAGAVSVNVSSDLEVVLLPLSTSYHLTNFKPEFMLALFNGPARDSDALFYLDPDICITSPWTFFEQWVSCGVALCEDINSPLAENHPRRIGWRRFYGSRGITLIYKSSAYVNGGLVGVSKADLAFLVTWKLLMELMESEIGSLSIALADHSAYRSAGFAACFDRTDQDALNATIEASDLSVSVIGQEAMAFKGGAAIVPHALGGEKPWTRNYLSFALRGIRPRTADRAFWLNVGGPLRVVGNAKQIYKRIEVKLASAIGRVYSNG
jgi:hypothetical protein